MTNSDFGWVVWTHRDKGTAGFVLDEELSAGTWPNDWRDSEPRMPIAQLAAVARGSTTAPYPLIHAEYLHGRNRWLIVSRGTGGQFGAAGTVQRFMAPESLGLAESWAHIFAAQRPDGLIDTRILSRPRIPKVSRPVAAACLVAMLQRDVAAIIRCSSQGMASAIALVASMVPEALVRQFIWGTWMEHRLPGSRTISAEWPEALQEAWPANYRTASRGAMVIDPTEPVILPRGLAWALEEALAGRYVANDSVSSTMDAWVAELEELVPWTLDEALDGLRIGDYEGLERRLTPELVVELVRSDPHESLQLLTSLERPEPVVAAFDAIQSARDLLVKELAHDARSDDLTGEYKLSLVVADNQPGIIESTAAVLIRARIESAAEGAARRAWVEKIEAGSANGKQLHQILNRVPPPDYALIRQQFAKGCVRTALDEVRGFDAPLEELRRALEAEKVSPELFAAFVLALEDVSVQDGQYASKWLSPAIDVISNVDRKPVKWVRAVIDDDHLTGLDIDRRFDLASNLLKWLKSGGLVVTSKLSSSIVAFLFPESARQSRSGRLPQKDTRSGLVPQKNKPRRRVWGVALTVFVVIVGVIIITVVL